QCIIMNNDTPSPPSHTLSTVSLLKSSCIDRSASANDSEPDVKSLIENLKDAIMKELSVSCVAESSVSLPAPSAASFPAAPSQSSTLAPVSDSPASATSVPVTLTPATSDFIISAFVISSPCFKEMLYRLNKSHLSRIISLFISIEI
ncbi:hypothetical protein BDFG_07222, partial [Blastomyces dermatitidis ATCC 26199]